MITRILQLRQELDGVYDVSSISSPETFHQHCHDLATLDDSTARFDVEVGLLSNFNQQFTRLFDGAGLLQHAEHRVRQLDINAVEPRTP